MNSKLLIDVLMVEKEIAHVKFSAESMLRPYVHVHLTAVECEWIASYFSDLAQQLKFESLELH